MLSIIIRTARTAIRANFKNLDGIYNIVHVRVSEYAARVRFYQNCDRGDRKKWFFSFTNLVLKYIWELAIVLYHTLSTRNLYVYSFETKSVPRNTSKLLTGTFRYSWKNSLGLILNLHRTRRIVTFPVYRKYSLDVPGTFFLLLLLILRNLRSRAHALATWTGRQKNRCTRE